MQLAYQLKGAGLAVFPCRRNKLPAVEKGHSWKTEALKPVEALSWPSGVVGLPIPESVVILDLDTYKGITRDVVDKHLNCHIPWDLAIIQETQSGGQHYAFRCSEPIRQIGEEKATPKGLDTRSPGKGYICTGDTYRPVGMGVFRLAHPESLPELPRNAIDVLKPHVPVTPQELPEGERDIDVIKSALAHINPQCTRAEWVRIGLALRHHFHDDPYSGYVLFDQWSSGSLLPNPLVPTNYDPDSTEGQFNSFGIEGGITIGTLFHNAIKSGWNPPANINAALAFGPNAATPETFGALIDKIIELGGDPKNTNDLMHEVESIPCNDLQREMLKATLTRELKEAGLYNKQVAEQMTGPKDMGQGEYGKNHTQNAVTFLENHFPNNTLVRAHKVWYSFNGKAWQEHDDDEFTAMVGRAMAHCLPQHNTVTGTVNMLALACQRSDLEINKIPRNLILLQNGVLDLHTGTLLPHSQDLFSINILPYNYNVYADCPEWDKFLLIIFEGDKQRIQLLQEWLGYLMCNDYSHQKVLLLLGPSRCGKGTIGKIIQLLVGDINFAGGGVDSLIDPDFMESLVTKTVMFDGDCQKSFGRGVNEAITKKLKNISGNDELFIRRKYKGGLHTRLPTRITVSANHIPRLFDDSGALAGRIMLLNFNVSFFGREDLELYDRLKKEIEGIALWALHGLARLQQNKRFTLPEASAVELNDIQEAYSPLVEFIGSCCRLEGDEVISSADLYHTYKAWAIQEEVSNILERRSFISSFKDVIRGKGPVYGAHRTDDGQVRGFKGIKLGRLDPVQTVSERAFKVVK